MNFEQQFYQQVFFPMFWQSFMCFSSVDAHPWMELSHHPTARSSLTLQTHAVRWCSADSPPQPLSPHSTWSPEPNPRSLAASPSPQYLTTHLYLTHTRPHQTTPLCQHRRVSASSGFSSWCKIEFQIYFIVSHLLRVCFSIGHGISLSHLDICIMNGKTYSQGQTWYDGCARVCVCEDGRTGYYRCSQRSVY